MPRGAVSGEIIAGVEPIEKTLEAIDLIAGLGAFPTVCVFRPTVGSDMENWASPSYEDMRRVMAHVLRRVPAQLDSDRRRSEYRGQHRRQPRRHGAARRAHDGVLRVRGVPQSREDRGEADLRAPSETAIVGPPHRVKPRRMAITGTARRALLPHREVDIRRASRFAWSS